MTRAKNMAAAALSAVLVMVHLAAFARAPERCDFAGVFYVAAQMLRHGFRHRLFDVGMQRALQLQYLHAGGWFFYSPPVVAAIYWPVSFLGLYGGFAAWTALSLGILFACVWLLRRTFRLEADATTLFCLALLFLPVHAHLLQGQVDLVVLFAICASLALTTEGHEVLGGLALSLGLVKFQFVLPLVAILLARRMWRSAAGFCLGAGAFVLACCAVSGVGTMLQYPAIVSHGSTISGDEIALMMPNVRGLLSLFGLDAKGFLLVSVSLLLVLLAAFWWRSVEHGFAISVVAAILVSYHSNPPALVLLLLPLALLAAKQSWKRCAAILLACSAAVFLGHVFHVLALGAIPILGLGLVLGSLRDPSLPALANLRHESAPAHRSEGA